jgi:hypothetical protein
MDHPALKSPSDRRDAAVLFQDRDALGYAAIAYMRGCPCHKAIHRVGGLAAERTSKLRPQEAAEPHQRRTELPAHESLLIPDSRRQSTKAGAWFPHPLKLEV